VLDVVDVVVPLPFADDAVLPIDEEADVDDAAPPLEAPPE
jgi:hypothetical protein